MGLNILVMDYYLKLVLSYILLFNFDYISNFQEMRVVYIFIYIGFNFDYIVLGYVFFLINIILKNRS